MPDERGDVRPGAASVKARLSKLWGCASARSHSDPAARGRLVGIFSRQSCWSMQSSGAGERGAQQLKATSSVSAISRWATKLFRSASGASAQTAGVHGQRPTLSCQDGGDLDGMVSSVDTIVPASPAAPKHYASTDHRLGCGDALAPRSGGREGACAQQEWAELPAVPVLRASLPRDASSAGAGGCSRRTPGLPTHSRQPQRYASALHLCAFLSAQVLAGAPNASSMMRAPSSPSFRTPRAQRSSPSHIVGPSSSPSLPRPPTSLPSLMIPTTRSARTMRSARTTRSTRMSSSLTTPGTPTSSPSFVAQFKPLLDPTMVAMLDQHSALQAEAANLRGTVHRPSLPSLPPGDRFMCNLVAGLDTSTASTLLRTRAPPRHLDTL